MEVSGLRFGYDERVLFEDFAIHSTRRLIGIMGPSGCGKTTLLKLLDGYLAPTVASGIPISSSSCLILQEDALFPWLTGWGNLMLVPGIRRIDVEDHPAYGKVEHFIDQRACFMSFGQRRILELLRAVIDPPEILLLDEPFNFLDPDLRSAAQRILTADRLRDTTIVIATHHRSDVSDIAEELFVFNGSFPVTSLDRICAADA